MEEETKKIRMTVNDLRKFRGFESISDEEGGKVVDMIFRLAVLSYNHVKKSHNS